MNVNYKKLKDFLKKNWKWILFFVALIGFLAIAEDVFNKEIMKADVIAYNLVVEKMRNNTLTSIFQIITNLGGTIILISIALILLIALKNRKIGLAVFSNLLIISGLNVLLKNILQRPRPEGYRIIAESGYSFPSGHSMISTAFYGFLVYLIYKNVKNKKLKYTLCILLGLLIPLICLSRVYLGVHYASDVIAGFLISISYLVIYINIVDRLIGKNQ